MFGQTFSFSDIPRVAFLAFLEMLLSADNAIVLAVISSALPEPFRKRALYIGMISAFAFRAIGILSVAFLLEFFWIQLVGALYLLYLSLRHFIKKKQQESLMPKPVATFWKTVLMIELFDLAFAVDSIVAGVAFISASPQEAIFHPKLWIVYIGGMVGVFGIRYAAHFFTSLIERYPKLETSAYAMIGWIGLKLGLTSVSWTFPHYEVVFWVGMFSILLLGFSKRKKHG